MARTQNSSKRDSSGGKPNNNSMFSSTNQSSASRQGGSQGSHLSAGDAGCESGESASGGGIPKGIPLEESKLSNEVSPPISNQPSSSKSEHANSYGSCEAAGILTKPNDVTLTHIGSAAYQTTDLEHPESDSTEVLIKADIQGERWYSPSTIVAKFEAKVRPVLRGRVFSHENYDELCATLSICVPIFFCVLGNNSINIINLTFLGHLGEDAMAAYGLASLFIACTGSSLIWGMLTALDTFGAQAYGAGNFKRVGLLLQRSFVVSAIMLVGIFFVAFNSESLLLFCQFDSDIAYRAARCIYVLAANLPSFTIFISIEHYLATQSITWPPMAFTIMGALIAFPLNHLYINIYELGYIGTSITTLTANTLMALGLWLYVYLSGIHKPTWPGWTKEALMDLGPYLRFGVVGMGSVMSEWLSYEFQVLLAGWMGTSALATQSLLGNILYFLFAFPLSLDTAMNVRVGNELGANGPQAAKRSAKVGALLAFTVQAITLTFVYIFWSSIGPIFTEEPSVLAMVSQVFALFIFAVFFDGIQGSLSGAIQGAGYPNFALYINVAGYWCVSLPLAYYLTFYYGSNPNFNARIEILKTGYWPETGRRYTPEEIQTLTVSSYYNTVASLLPTTRGLGLYGQWIAIAVGPVLVMSAFIFFLATLDWEQVAQGVVQREKDENEMLLERERVKMELSNSSRSLEKALPPAVVVVSPALVARPPRATQHVNMMTLSPRIQPLTPRSLTSVSVDSFTNTESTPLLRSKCEQS